MCRYFDKVKVYLFPTIIAGQLISTDLLALMYHPSVHMGPVSGLN